MEITKERIKELAAKSGADEAVLRRLLPEVFEDEKYFDFSKTAIDVLKLDVSWPDNFRFYNAIQIRNIGDHAYKGFYLYRGYDWEIVTDNHGAKVLIPTKRK